MRYFHITIPVNNPNEQLVLVLEFAVALQRIARKQGGDGRILRLAQCVKIELSGLSPHDLQIFFNGFADHLIREGLELELATAARTTPSIPPGIQLGEHLRERLTKKFLQSLPTGAFLISGKIDPSHLHPVWIGRLLPTTDRQALWTEAVSTGAAGKDVLLAWNFEDYLLLVNSRYREHLHNYKKQVES